MRLRPARPEDCSLYWEWTNEPSVREASFQSDPIPWDEHATWFATRLADPGSQLLVAEDDDGVPIGQIRFQRIAADEVEVHLSVAPSARGRGVGGALLRDSAGHLAEGVTSVLARVKRGNDASLRMFERVGFGVLDDDSAIVRLRASVDDLTRAAS